MRIVKSSVAQSPTGSAGRGAYERGMASSQIIALTPDQTNAHDGKEQRVDQRHRQYHRQSKLSRFARRLRHPLIRDEQHHKDVAARYDSISIHRLAGYNCPLADWSGALSTEKN